MPIAINLREKIVKKWKPMLRKDQKISHLNPGRKLMHGSKGKDILKDKL